MQIPVSGLKVVGNECVEVNPESFDEVVELIRSPEFVWLDFDLYRAPVNQVVELLKDKLDFHPLTVEECVTPDIYQPKVEEERGYKFFIIHYFREARKAYFKASELNIYLGENFVLTLHRSPIPTYLSQFKTNIPEDLYHFNDKAIIFFYHILDVVIDDYLRMLVLIQKRADEIEFKFLIQRELKLPIIRVKLRRSYGLSTMEEVIALRHNILLMRKSFSEELKILAELSDFYEKPKEPLPIPESEREEIVVYIGTLINHLEQALHINEQEREILNQNLQIHDHIVNVRSQEIMRVLTIVMAIFLPITFITGFYGMNLPNLHGVATLGNALIWILDGVMIGVVSLLLYFFYKSNWF